MAPYEGRSGSRVSVSRGRAPARPAAAPARGRIGVDNVARYVFEKVIPGARNANVFLENGARLYLDTGFHPEYATPECDDIVRPGRPHPRNLETQPRPFRLPSDLSASSPIPMQAPTPAPRVLCATERSAMNP